MHEGFMQQILRAFQYRNFRIYFSGQSFSLLGTWVQQVAISWLVYRLTHSAMLLGATGFFSQIPILLLAPFSGFLSDRFDRRKILFVTQVLAMLQAFILAYLVWKDLIQVWHILLLSGTLGTIAAFEIPARQSMMVHLVEKKSDLPNAIALNSLLVNTSRLVGPVIAGFTISLVGEVACFLLNGFSYIAVITSLIFMRPDTKKMKHIGSSVKQHPVESLKEGVKYAAHNPSIKSLLILLALASFMIMPYLVLMPIFASEVFHGDAQTMGFLLAPAGLGAICSNLLLASRKSMDGLCKFLVLGLITAGSALLLFSMSHTLLLSMFLMGFVGFGFIVQVVSSNMILQTLTDEDKRGRVMSLYTMAYMGMIPLGSFVAGDLAKHIGAPETLLVCGICSITCGLIFALKMKGGAIISRPICAETR
jgi:MFS family permease